MQLSASIKQFLAGIGVSAIEYIPVSGREGDGLVTLSKKMTWYQGQTVLEAMDSFEKEKPINDLALAFSSSGCI